MGAIKPPQKTKNKMNTSSSYFVLRAIDSFGDNWPLASRTVGIDGDHATFEAAKASAAKYVADKDFRKALRISNGWAINTIKKLEISEVTCS